MQRRTLGNARSPGPLIEAPIQYGPVTMIEGRGASPGTMAALVLAIVVLPATGRAADCGSALPAPGARFAGPVLQVTDGRSFCVARGPDPATWIPVRLPPRSPSDDRGALMAAAFAKTAVCVAEGSDGDAVVARCAIDEVDLSRILASPAVRREGRRWR